MTQDTFEFRNFKIQQSPGGQRINTDSCVFAGLLTSHVRPRKILDIGTGSGLIALMLADKFSEALITAVEADNEIAALAGCNFAGSPWAARLSLFSCRLQELECRLDQGSFDLIVCNPPFFRKDQSLISTNLQRARARHDIDLSPADLFAACDQLLEPDGQLWLCCAAGLTVDWLQKAESRRYFISHDIRIADHPETRRHLNILALTRRRLSESHVTVPTLLEYRQFKGGPYTNWMQRFREEWFPDRFQTP